MLSASTSKKPRLEASSSTSPQGTGPKKTASVVDLAGSSSDDDESLNQQSDPDDAKSPDNDEDEDDDVFDYVGEDSSSSSESDQSDGDSDADDSDDSLVRRATKKKARGQQHPTRLKRTGSTRVARSRSGGNSKVAGNSDGDGSDGESDDTDSDSEEDEDNDDDDDNDGLQDSDDEPLVKKQQPSPNKKKKGKRGVRAVLTDASLGSAARRAMAEVIHDRAKFCLSVFDVCEYISFQQRFLPLYPMLSLCS